MLKLNAIPTDTSIFSIGGHSLLIMQLFRRYKIEFHLETNILSIADLFQCPTISVHARLLAQQANKTTPISINSNWYPLHLTTSEASLAQQRIFLDEQIRFASQTSKNIYAIPHLYRPSATATHMSLSRLYLALHAVVTKHTILRTALYLDTDGTIVQRCLESNISSFDRSRVYGFTIISLQNDDRQITETVRKIQNQPDLFDLSQGRVLHCHILRQSHLDEDILTDRDFILINIHHAAFDGASTSTFLSDLALAYENSQSLERDEDTLQYIDYAVHEHVMDMTPAHDFWYSHLEGYHLQHPLALPMDRQRSSTTQRSSLASTAHIVLDNDVAAAFLNYASSHHLTLFQLGLATFYAFLFKLTHGQDDLCVASINANRYRSELVKMIGMFVSTLPYRVQLDPYWSFDELVRHVREKCLSILEHSHYPLQHILADFHLNQSNASFLETMFDSITVSPIVHRFSLNGVELEQVSMGGGADGGSKFDFSVTFVHNKAASDKQLSCFIACSQDLFDVESVDKIGQRLHCMIQRMFSIMGDHIETKICESALVLPNERMLMQSMNNTEMQYSSASCIHHEFVRQVVEHPQKLAVELDEQSLTYTELLYHAQLLSLYLLEEYHIIPGDIICQCVERSVSMVIGIMAIEMVGGVYCPLSPRDPKQRLLALVEQTKSRLVLVHHLTMTKFHDTIVSLNTDPISINARLMNAIDLNPWSAIEINSDHVSYVIFTSGSTGVPKAIQVRHHNIIQFMHSLVHDAVLSEKDTILQVARCSFDVHVQDIIGTLSIGATLIMLHPEGIYDFDYLAQVMRDKAVSCITTVPTILHNFFTFLKEIDSKHVIPSLRTVCSGGEVFSGKLSRLIASSVNGTCRIWNVYGPAETTIDCTLYLLNGIYEHENVATGRPLSNYRCLILDNLLQPVVVEQEGELYVGGVGVFAGYLGRDDLTSKALASINNLTYYRTGDLVRMDGNGLLHYIGRKDFQVKLRGQRIEVGEIEQCLFNTSISACVVMKWGEDHLVAYIQSSAITEEELREHCQSRLPPYMIPSKFIILDKLPLNANGKIDRKELPLPRLSNVETTQRTNVVILTPLEEQLWSIFKRSFHSESTDIEMSFGLLGGTSLDAIRVLSLIRQEISTKVDIGLLFANPSVRQLARVIEPLIVIGDNLTNSSTGLQVDDDHDRSMSCLYIEILGIILLVCQWLFPMWLAYQFHSFFTLLTVPVFHLVTYIISQHLLLRREKIMYQRDKLYSWQYYQWWFLNTMWSINNSFWLKHLLGTPFYNFYLRLCGADVGRNSHIYTTSIDAPWLLRVGDFTFIGDEVILSSLSYQTNTYTLGRISIGSHCCINTRSVLYEDVKIEDGVFIEPMSTVSGPVPKSNSDIFMKNQVVSWKQSLYQFGCLSIIFLIHILILLCTYTLYSSSRSLMLPLPICIALGWLTWVLISFFIALFLLKFLVGSVTSNHCSVNSFYYMHKIWLRQMIITSFHHSLDVIPSYSVVASIILRWLGAKIEDDVRLAEFRQILYFPANLLFVKSDVTTFGGAKLATFEMTKDGLCRLDEIQLGSGTNLTNWCTLMPGTRLVSNTMVGSLTLVTRQTVNNNINSTLLGIPAREMPFQLSDSPRSSQNNRSTTNSISIQALLLTCLSFFISKLLLIALYSLFSVFASPFIHIIFTCTIYHYSIWLSKNHSQFSYSKTISSLQQIIHMFLIDFYTFVGPFLSRTQYLVYVFRGFGARIGCDAILPDIGCLTDPYLTTLGNHIRLQRGAHIQCHTFEQRLLKLAPVVIHHSSVLMSNTLILPGSVLQGQNRILPWTLIMKNDQLQPNTSWSGVPGHRTR